MSGGAKRLLVAAGAVLAANFYASSADAGCGCDKPPPPPAQVRPAFASPGQDVTLFGAGIVGGPYRVTFEAAGASLSVDAPAVRQRDLADGVEKFQLVVPMPAGLPLGPAEIRVTRAGQEVLRVDATQFTVLQVPLRLEESDGLTVAQCYRAAVDAAGTVYFAFDVGAIQDRMVFSGIARGYPLLFTADDVTIWNTQGFLMQLLSPDQAGRLYAIQDPGSPHSFELIYDRHEFVTYAQEHVHEADLALGKDPRWHVDGTPHIDHDHLVLAIDGRLEDGSVPQAGATPSFELSVVTALDDDATKTTTRTIAWGSDCTTGAAD